MKIRYIRVCPVHLMGPCPCRACEAVLPACSSCPACSGDGCDKDVAPSLAATPHADGHEARYCAPCNDGYEEFVRIVQIEETRLNAVLDAFIKGTPARAKLRFVPQDLPMRTAPAGLILG